MTMAKKRRQEWKCSGCGQWVETHFNAHVHSLDVRPIAELNVEQKAARVSPTIDVVMVPRLDSDPVRTLKEFF